MATQPETDEALRVRIEREVRARMERRDEAEVRRRVERRLRFHYLVRELCRDLDRPLPERTES